MVINHHYLLIRGRGGPYPNARYIFQGVFEGEPWIENVHLHKNGTWGDIEQPIFQLRKGGSAKKCILDLGIVHPRNGGFQTGVMINL